MTPVVSSLPLPSSLGLPGESFPSFRPPQYAAAVAIASSLSRFNFADAPPGAGKTLLGFTVAQLLGARTLYLVSTKQLADQVSRDFGGMVDDLRGRSNYTCPTFGTCESGREGGCPLQRDDRCPHNAAKTRAASSQLVLSNFATWLTMARYEPDAIGKFDLLVLDEAHLAPIILADSCVVEISRKDVGQLLGLDLPDSDDLAGWVAWARIALDKARAELASRRGERSPLMRRLTQLVRSADALTSLDAKATTWVLDRTPDGATWSPVWAHQWGESLLFRGVPKVLLMSATLTRETARFLGVDATSSSTSWHEIPSSFPAARAPFYYIPTVRIDRRTTPEMMRYWMSRVDALIEARGDRNGVIHSRSYDRMREIVSLSRNAHLMLSHSSRDTAAVVARFKLATPPAVLVSPAVEEGHDFAYDQARYQIISKVPYPDTRSPVMRERCKDKTYANNLAAQAIMQTAGRVMRAADDLGETMILDDNWAWFKNAVKWPGHFVKRWRRVDSLPAPLRP